MLRSKLVGLILDVNEMVQARRYERHFHADGAYRFGGYDSLVFEKSRFELMLKAAGGRSYARALEVGCAEGAFTQRLAGLAGEVVALEVSPTALANARRRLEGKGRVRFFKSGVRRWRPGPGETFDLIVLSEVLYCLGERNDLLRFFGATAADCVRPVLAKLAALLEPGGRLILAHSYSTGQRKGRELYRQLAENLGLTLLSEEDVPPTGEPGTDRCLVSCLERGGALVNKTA